MAAAEHFVNNRRLRDIELHSEDYKSLTTENRKSGSGSSAQSVLCSTLHRKQYLLGDFPRCKSELKMNNTPLSAVENIDSSHGNCAQPFMVFQRQLKPISRSSLGKSPRKLSTHEKTVINGLKQLTELIFKPHFIQEDGNAIGGANATESPSKAKPIFSLRSSVAHSQWNGDSLLDAAMKDAEKFCALVITNITSDSSEMDNDWHAGQLNAYESASQQVLAKDERKACARNLRDF